MKFAALALALTLALTGCGGAAAVGGGGPKYPDTKALAEALGCGSSHKLDGPDVMPFGAKETATCNSDEYSLAVFRDDKTRDAFVEAVGAFGRSFAVGDGWSVSAPSVESAQKAAEKLDGKVV